MVEETFSGFLHSLSVAFGSRKLGRNDKRERDGTTSQASLVRFAKSLRPKRLSRALTLVWIVDNDLKNPSCGGFLL
jgi:hypothetical protein